MTQIRSIVQQPLAAYAFVTIRPLEQALHNGYTTVLHGELKRVTELLVVVLMAWSVVP